MIYKLCKNLLGNTVGILKNNEIFIPMDEANTDYQAYLAWVAEGNEPLPAEAV